MTQVAHRKPIVSQFIKLTNGAKKAEDKYSTDGAE